MNITLAEMPYLAVQGEGASMGKPCLFVRTFGCNLQCKWCDTAYSWDPKLANQCDKQVFNLEDMTDMIIEKLADSPYIKRVVWTGGEPTLHHEQIAEVIRRLPAYVDHEIETNGSFEVSDKFISLFEIFTVSLKRENSGNDMKIAENRQALLRYSGHANVVWKFVCTDRYSVHDVLNVQSTYDLRPEQIYIMPEGRKKHEVMKYADFLIEECINNGFNFSTRMHILVYGNKKGV